MPTKNDDDDRKESLRRMDQNEWIEWNLCCKKLIQPTDGNEEEAPKKTKAMRPKWKSFLIKW